MCIYIYIYIYTYIYMSCISLSLVLTPSLLIRNYYYYYCRGGRDRHIDPQLQADIKIQVMDGKKKQNM